MDTMDNLIADFPNQLAEAIEIGENASHSPAESQIKNIVVSGLGGSGIGGSLVKELVSDELTIPFEVNKGYHLPTYVNENTLIIISSYSGNTEETLHAFQQAIKGHAKIACITSNGQILETAIEQHLDHVVIPGGMPPRACLGYSFIQQLYILNAHGVIGRRVINEIKDSIELLRSGQDTIKKTAKQLAGVVANKLPVIYIEDALESVAVRFRQQLNENAKMLCWHHVIPEMNHNELVGWKMENMDIVVLLLRTYHEFDRNKQRIEINKSILESKAADIIEIQAKGKNKGEMAMYLIHLCDWISFYAAEIRDVDPVEVNVIDELKSRLSQLR